MAHLVSESERFLLGARLMMAVGSNTPSPADDILCNQKIPCVSMIKCLRHSRKEKHTD